MGNTNGPMGMQRTLGNAWEHWEPTNLTRIQREHHDVPLCALPHTAELQTSKFKVPTIRHGRI